MNNCDNETRKLWIIWQECYENVAKTPQGHAGLLEGPLIKKKTKIKEGSELVTQT